MTNARTNMECRGSPGARVRQSSSGSGERSSELAILRLESLSGPGSRHSVWRRHGLQRCGGL